MTLRPSWLNEDCPSWCVRQHDEQDLPDDRYHRGEPSTFPAIVVAEPGIHLTALMHGLDLVVWIGRYVDEVLDWMVIEPADQRDPDLVLSVESAALLLDQIALQLTLAGRFVRDSPNRD